ncbi:hypothetical protein U1Q18_003325 [Sarracenia purpurea var. burkii]
MVGVCEISNVNGTKIAEAESSLVKSEAKSAEAITAFASSEKRIAHLARKPMYESNVGAREPYRNDAVSYGEKSEENDSEDDVEVLPSNEAESDNSIVSPHGKKATQKPQTIRTEWIKVGKGKNGVGDFQGEAPEADLPSSSNMPICTTTPLEAEGTGCSEGIGEPQDGLVSEQVESPNGEDQTVADQDVNTQEVQLKGCSPQAPSPAERTVVHTEPSKGIIFLPRSPLTRSQSMNKMDPIIMEGQGTQEDPLTPAAIRASSPPIPPERSSSSKKKNKRSK